MRDRHGKTAAVDVVELHVNDLQAELIRQPLDLPKGVVFQVFVTDRVVGVDLEHERQVALFQMPDAVGCEHVADLFDKGGRRFQIVKHRDGTDDFCLCRPVNFLEIFGGKEIHYKIHARLVVFAEFFG